MKQEDINNIWNYFLSLESDFSDTSRYIEPKGQEDVHSFEFYKLLILSCTEVESLMKLICEHCEGRKYGDIGDYKGIILYYFSKITSAKVIINRWGKTIMPFENWDKGPLFWWDDYCSLKHDRNSNFEKASYKSAVYSLSALYILIFYVAKIYNLEFKDYISSYIDSDYCHFHIIYNGSPLPDFEGKSTL